MHLQLKPGTDVAVANGMLHVIVKENLIDPDFIKNSTNDWEATRAVVEKYTPDVAAQMTDLLQTTVNTGTGRAAQIGRPVAGKTGTTSASKDGWFLGFSSGLTTGVWMGRDDAKPIAGLHGGTAPARAFAQFMKVAVAKRPVEQFDTQVTLPDQQIEPDEESYFGAPDDTGSGGSFVDEDGNPIADPRQAPASP